MKEFPVEGLGEVVSWQDYDPTNWRDRPEPQYSDMEDDQDHPVPDDVFAITGIDPDEEGWD